MTNYMFDHGYVDISNIYCEDIIENSNDEITFFEEVPEAYLNNKSYFEMYWY